MPSATEQPSPSQPTNAGSQLNHEVTKHRFEDGNHMGWALRNHRKAMQFSEKQVEFLVDVFMEGEKTNRKMDPLTVADMMQTATDKNGEKRFSTSEYLRHEQIASYFSRLAVSERKDGNLNSPGINTVDDALPTAEEDEDLCDMKQCLEDMQVDEEMMLLQDSLAPIANDPTNGNSSSTGSTTSQPKDQLKFQVRDGVQGKEVKVYGDGRCMFRSVAVYLDQTLQKCMRSDGGWPLQQQLASKETSAADSLWNQTLVKMAENVNMYQEKNEQQGYDKDFDVDFGSFQKQLK